MPHCFFGSLLMHYLLWGKTKQCHRRMWTDHASANKGKACIKHQGGQLSHDNIASSILPVTTTTRHPPPALPPSLALKTNFSRISSKHQLVWGYFGHRWGIQGGKIIKEIDEIFIPQSCLWGFQITQNLNVFILIPFCEAFLLVNNPYPIFVYE